MVNFSIITFYVIYKKVMNTKTLINSIRDKRKAKKISQVEIAKHLGITQAQYSRYEKGESEMTLTMFLKIVQFLELEIFNIVNMISKDDLNTMANIIDKYRNA